MSGMLPAIWFLLLGFLLTGYAVLDGIDLGVGIVLPLVARDQEQRGSLFRAIGPFWSGYEVWLVGAGGAMLAAFPRLYADSFSGFYLVLTLVLWLLIARGGSIEFRNAIVDPLWRGFWDFVFFAASALLALLYGAAFGNVVRGVPLDSSGNFQGSFAQALNPYALGIGLLSVVLLGTHGAVFTARRTDGVVQVQARRAAKMLWPAAMALMALLTVASFFARPDIAANFARHPWLAILPLATLACAALTRLAISRADDSRAVTASSATIGLLMATAGASLYPRLLPAYHAPQNDLTIWNCSAPAHNLLTALIAYLIGMALILTYSTYLHRVFRDHRAAAESGASH